MKYLTLLTLLALAGCDYPRDIEGTLDHVRAERVIRVGVIAGADEDRDKARIAAYLARVGRAAGAVPNVTRGAAEPLFARLDQGDLDLVIGELAQDSPWKTDVMMVEPIAERQEGKARIALSPIARNGENRWIMLLERAVRDLKAGA
jgi:hypothetical protein